MMTHKVKFLTSLFIVLLIASCRNAEPATVEAVEISPAPAPVTPSAAVPEWSKDATIYEVNIRQITPEGTFRAFTDQRMEEIAGMGIDILWLMPVYPISSTKKKGSLGSYYAVSDFRSVNPEFGTEAELRQLIDRAHELDMRVIFDFVPNHTGWDHVWLRDHPDWYTQDSLGRVTDPIDPKTGESWGWTDVADLNHGNPEMRAAMINDLVYWMDGFSVDGYRMDVAGEVDSLFWAEAIPALRAANPEVFLLAEAQEPIHRNEEWFAANYGWDFHHLMNAIAKGEESAAVVKSWYADKADEYEHGWHMHFLTNHDENSWNGTVEERMGDNWAPLAVLAATLEGMPLIYGGQEAGLNKRVAFFDKDTIAFDNKDRYPFYTKLNQLKHDNQALWNGPFGGKTVFLEYEGDRDKTIAYYRARFDDTVMVFLNFSDEERELILPGGGPRVGNFLSIFGVKKGQFINGTVTLPAHGYLVLSNS